MKPQIQDSEKNIRLILLDELLQTQHSRDDLQQEESTLKDQIYKAANLHPSSPKDDTSLFSYENQ